MNQIATKAKFTDKKFMITLVFVTSLFMFWGIAITMADVLNKHFQHTMSLTKSQSAFVQFAVFGAYAVMGIPAGLFMKRFGYKKGYCWAYRFLQLVHFSLSLRPIFHHLHFWYCIVYCRLWLVNIGNSGTSICSFSR